LFEKFDYWQLIIGSRKRNVKPHCQDNRHTVSNATVPPGEEVACQLSGGRDAGKMQLQ
jgi:hypothetical protein